MGIPQILVIVLWALSLGLTLAKHGEPRGGKESVWTALVGVAIMAALLWWGGFWG